VGTRNPRVSEIVKNIVRYSIDIVIVTYNSAQVISACLEALERHPFTGPFHTIIIDNCSRDNTVAIIREQFPQVELIENQHNVGLAAAWNQALRQGNNNYVLLLNPDTQVSAGAIDLLARHLDTNPTAGAVGPQLVGIDGRVQLSCREFPNLLSVVLRGTKLDRFFPGNASLQRYLMSDWDHQQMREVDWLLGACILLRRSALDTVGMFDDGFFLYYEDIDWCSRAWTAGWHIHYLPQAQILHHYQRESARGLNRQFFHHLHSIVRLFRKHRLPLW
jgi:GT2 family glycosyltransferase